MLHRVRKPIRRVSRTEEPVEYDRFTADWLYELADAAGLSEYRGAPSADAFGALGQERSARFAPRAFRADSAWMEVEMR
jgi:hypothetical protein